MLGTARPILTFPLKGHDAPRVPLSLGAGSQVSAVLAVGGGGDQAHGQRCEGLLRHRLKIIE